ncbi:hypothetical protein MKZ01_17985 [Lysinibacillus endophyticus]
MSVTVQYYVIVLHSNITFNSFSKNVNQSSRVERNEIHCFTSV